MLFVVFKMQGLFSIMLLLFFCCSTMNVIVFTTPCLTLPWLYYFKETWDILQRVLKNLLSQSGHVSCICEITVIAGWKFFQTTLNQISLKLHIQTGIKFYILTFLSFIWGIFKPCSFPIFSNLISIFFKTSIHPNPVIH